MLRRGTFFGVLAATVRIEVPGQFFQSEDAVSITIGLLWIATKMGPFVLFKLPILVLVVLSQQALGKSPNSLFV